MNPDLNLFFGLSWHLIALMAIWKGKQDAKKTRSRAVADLWLQYAVLLVLIGFAQLTNVGPQVAQMVRNVAKEEGWYRFRGEVQFELIRGVGIASALVLCLGIVKAFKHGLQGFLMFSALAWTFGFQSIRGISLHHVDAMMAQRFGQLTLAQWGTTVGIALAFLPMLAQPRETSRKRDRKT